MPLLVLFPPFLTDFFTPVLADRPSDARPFVAAIAAQLVVADAVVHTLERYVVWPMAFVFAVVSGEADCGIVVSDRSVGE